SVLMAVLTLGEAWKLGWRVRARCLWGGPDPHSRHNRISIECDTTVRLDMETLVWTRGHKFPLDQLSSRLKCPKCGERRVQVYFEVPGEPKARTVRAAGCPSKASRRTSPVGRSRTKWRGAATASKMAERIDYKGYRLEVGPVGKGWRA